MNLDVLKRRLGYLNGDEQTDLLLTDLADEGERFLKRYCPKLDFDSPTPERGLLCEYVRYSLSNALDDFVVNYKPELIALSNKGRLISADD